MLMPPPYDSAEGTDANTDSVWPSGWHFVSILALASVLMGRADAGKHTEEGEVILDVFVQLLKYKNRLFSSHFFKKTHQFTRFSTKKKSELGQNTCFFTNLFLILRQRIWLTS